MSRTSWSERKKLVEEALSSSRARFSATTARCPCPKCEGERGKRDNKLSLTVNLQSSAFYCHRCGLKGTCDIEQAKLWAQTRAYFENEVGSEESPEAIRAREDSMWHNLLSEGSARGYGQFLLTQHCGRAPAYNGRTVALDHITATRNCPAFTASDARTLAFIMGRWSFRVNEPDHYSINGVGFLIVSPTLPSVAFGNETLFNSQRLLGWVLRDMTGNSGCPRYTNAPGMNRAEVFYNEAALLVTTTKPVVVVEGCFDALSRWPDGVAVLGKLSRWQKDQLIGCPRPVLIVPDGDAWEAGRMDAMELAHHGQTAGFLRLPAGKDPDEYSQAEWDKLVAEKAEWF